MNSLIKNFLDKNEQNKALFLRFKLYNDEKALEDWRKNLKYTCLN